MLDYLDLAHFAGRKRTDSLFDAGRCWAEILGLTHLGDADVLLDYNTPCRKDIAIC